MIFSCPSLGVLRLGPFASTIAKGIYRNMAAKHGGGGVWQRNMGGAEYGGRTWRPRGIRRRSVATASGQDQAHPPPRQRGDKGATKGQDKNKTRGKKTPGIPARRQKKTAGTWGRRRRGANDPRKKGRPGGKGRERAPIPYLILVSLKRTCRRATGSYFFFAILSVLVLGFFFVT